MLPLHLALNIIQIMIFPELVQALGFLDQGVELVEESSDAHVVEMSFLVLEECLLHDEDI
jgi:hypothetical protein